MTCNECALMLTGYRKEKCWTDRRYEGLMTIGRGVSGGPYSPTILPSWESTDVFGLPHIRSMREGLIVLTDVLVHVLVQFSACASVGKPLRGSTHR